MSREPANSQLRNKLVSVNLLRNRQSRFDPLGREPPNFAVSISEADEANYAVGDGISGALPFGAADEGGGSFALR